MMKETIDITQKVTTMAPRRRRMNRSIRQTLEVGP
jgi:hypothetical protein